MVATWVIEEMKDVNLEDKRLNSRLAVIVDQLGGHPTTSIPAACGGYAETMAAYRFVDNEKAGFESILQSHMGATWRHDRKLNDISVNVVLVREVGLPRGKATI